MNFNTLANIKTKNYLILLFLVILVGSFLRLYRLETADFYLDSVTYSYRAIGMLDYMGNTNNQTTPIQWFKELPWWSSLSFHDHPIVSFFIRHIFYRIFGVSTFTARLPDAIAGIITIFLFYLIAQIIFDKETALFSSLIFSIGNLFVFLNRITYIDNIWLVFILLTIYFFIKGEKNDKNFIWMGLFLGLSILTKLTTLFIIPVILTYLIINFLKGDRRILANKKLIIGFLLTIIISSVLITYNLMMLKERGHFDVQISSLAGQDNSDWPIIQKGVRTDFINHFFGLIKDFYNNNDPVLFFTIVISIFYFLITAIKDTKFSRANLFILILLFWSFVFILLVEATEQIFTVLFPALLLITGYTLSAVFRKIRHNKASKVIFYFFVIILITSSLFYTYQTNISNKPLGNFYGRLRVGNSGYTQLGEYIEKVLLNRKKTPVNIIRTIPPDHLSEYIFKDELVVLADPNMEWAGRFWYFNRRLVYDQEKFFDLKSLEIILDPDDIIGYFLNQGASEVVFIKATKDALLDKASHLDNYSNRLEDYIKSNYIFEFADIKNYSNQEAFRIYRIKSSSIDPEVRDLIQGITNNFPGIFSISYTKDKNFNVAYYLSSEDNLVIKNQLDAILNGLSKRLDNDNNIYLKIIFEKSLASIPQLRGLTIDFSCNKNKLITQDKGESLCYQDIIKQVGIILTFAKVLDSEIKIDEIKDPAVKSGVYYLLEKLNQQIQ